MHANLFIHLVMRINRLSAISGALVLAVLLSSAASAQTESPLKNPANLPTVSTSPSSGIERQDIRAQLKAVQYATLAAELGARIKRLPVKEGGRFAQDDVLVELDCSVQEAQKIKAQAELDGASHTLRANEQMRALKSVGALEVSLAKSARDRAAAELKSLQAQLEKCIIKAPFAGVMGDRRVQQFEYIQAGQPVLEIFDDSMFEVEFLTPSRWISWLKPGLNFELEIDELKIKIPVTIARVGARIDPVSQSLKVTGQIKNPSRDLKPGMSGQALLKQP
jgi:membrane fusion protein (multidrug efflux system)